MAVRLPDLQRAFSRAIFNARDQQILASVKALSSAAAGKRLDIYRNNVFHALTTALADLYPVVKRLVGEQFFNAMAFEYNHQRPPRSAAMVNYASDFPEFLIEFKHTAGMYYLVDVARLELARHRAYHSADAIALSASDFSALTPLQLAGARIVLHPSVCLLPSAYPLLQIWDANQDGYTGEDRIDLNSAGVILCVCRPDFEVVIREVDEATYTLLLSLQEQDKLEAAIQKSSEFASAEDVSVRFARCINDGLFTTIIGA